MPKYPPPPPPPAIPPAPPAVPDAGLLTLHAAVDGRIGTPGKTCRNSDFLWQHYPRWHNRLEPTEGLICRPGGNRFGTRCCDDSAGIGRHAQLDVCSEPCELVSYNEAEWRCTIRGFRLCSATEILSHPLHDTRADPGAQRLLRTGC